MAGDIKVNQIQLGDSGVAGNNLVIKTNQDGTFSFSRGNIGGALTPILSIDANGVVTPVKWDLGRTYKTPSRALATTYTNNSGADIELQIEISATAGSVARLTVDGVILNEYGSPAINNQVPVVATIKPGSTYALTQVSGTVTIVRWTELSK